MRPIQASASTSMPASFSVGIPGSSAERSAVVTARIFTLPETSCGTTEIAGRHTICTSLRISAVIACGDEEYGTWTSCVPLFSAIASMASCDSEPVPIEP